MSESSHDPLWQSAPTPFSAQFVPLDLAVEVRSTHADLLSLAAEALGPPGHAPVGRPRFGLLLIGDPDADADSPPDDSREPRGVHEGPPTAHRERDGLFAAVVSGAGVVTADLNGARAAAFVERKALRHAELRLRAGDALVGAPVWRFAARIGLVALHGAAVATPAGALVLRGPSGSGKTTAACAAGLHGWPVLTDEVVWVDCLGPEPLLRGAQPYVRPDIATRRLLPALDGLGAADGSGGVRLGPGGLPRATSMPLGPIAFLEPREASPAGTFRRIDREAAVALFELAAIPGERTQVPEAVAAARDTLLARGAFEVRIGSPDHLPDLLAALVDAARSG